MKQIYSMDSVGSHGRFTLHLNVDVVPLPPSLYTEEIQQACATATKLVHDAVMREVVKHSETAKLQTKTEREEITGLFPSTIFVDEIPNGYCSDWCCKHLPWFNITTPIGRWTIGWRKRVLSIDWSETINTKTAKELFPDEPVTKGDKFIHAWTITDANRYIKTIMASTVA
jgi:hypothetical protein